MGAEAQKIGAGLPEQGGDGGGVRFKTAAVLVAQAPAGRVHPNLFARFSVLERQSAINRPRFIVEDNIVYVEKALPADVQKELEQKGYQVIVKPTGMYYGGVQGIRVNRSKNKMEGGFDGRRDGAFRFGAD